MVYGAPWSCDSMVALADVVRLPEGNRAAIFAKNSDRPVTDSTPVIVVPRQQHSVDARIELGYTNVKQVGVTLGTIGVPLHFTWGYEMGANAAGVAIGCQAASTKPHLAAVRLVKTAQPPALPEADGPLSACDLARLGLERGRTALEVLHHITGLLEKHGQWGSSPLANWARTENDNSFLIADAETAWVLDTAGSHWAALRIRSGVRAAGNALSIRETWDLCSEGMVQHAVDQGWWPAEEAAAGRFDFAAAFGGGIENCLHAPHERAQRANDLLQRQVGEATGVTVEGAMSVLRDHYGNTLNPAMPTRASLCQHWTPTGNSWGDTASSLLVILPADAEPVVFYCAGTPCTGIFLPMFFTSQTLSIDFGLHLAGSVGNDRIALAPRYLQADSEPDSFQAESYTWLWKRVLNVAKGWAPTAIPNPAHEHALSADPFMQRHAAIRKVLDGPEKEAIRIALALSSCSPAVASPSSEISGHTCDWDRCAMELTSRITKLASRAAHVFAHDDGFNLSVLDKDRQERGFNSLANDLEELASALEQSPMPASKRCRREHSASVKD